jgi:hypothetical protein
LVYADDVNLLGNGVNTIKENSETLLEGSRDIGLEINAEKTKYMIMWHAWGRGEVFTGFWLGGLKARDHWEDLGIGGRITLKWTLGR